MKRLVLGILAHVDAGKTTLCEALLYTAGAIRTLGRVDHRDTFLDTHAIERERGITVFAKQARLETEGLSLTLLDTPGHADFSAETERTLQVLDCAALVISGTDGVQAHTETLWQLLERYHIPTFVFITKMDLPGPGREALLADLQRHLSPVCVDFSARHDRAWAEELAVCDEALLERYMERGSLTNTDLRSLVEERKLFPCYFGSGLKLEGVEAFLQGLESWGPAPVYPESFSARVYKVAHETRGGRLTYLKVTGGTLRVRDSVCYTTRDGEEKTEKISQIRMYSGDKFTQAEEAPAGTVCAVTGLGESRPGQRFGETEQGEEPLLEPVLTYRLVLPPETDARLLLPRLRQLEEEDPLLRLSWNARTQEIHVLLFGQVQIEVLCRLIRDRFGVEAALDQGRILYRETIAAPVEGIGHFEPLRHYAEVHLLLEPLPQGSGLVFGTACSEDVLDGNWQRLILTHLEEKPHLGVLTGSPITDMRITLLTGRAHIKHTEGGDFRQATYRAVRQGLMQAESRLLEPWYSFRLEVPAEQIGRAISDVRAMSGTFDSPETAGETAVLTGRAPVAAMGDYTAQVAAYTRGRGRLSCTVAGYAPCHNPRAVIDGYAYDPCADPENSPDSVFCAHGAGVNVKWDQVAGHAHMDSGWRPVSPTPEPTAPVGRPRLNTRNLDLDEKELEAIMEREFGPIHRAPLPGAAAASRRERPQVQAPPPGRTDYLIVDGYNVIFAWETLAGQAEYDLSAARLHLMDILASYRGFTRCELVLVFDGYKVAGNPGERRDYHGIHVAYTRENETGDMFIEKLAREIGLNYRVRVVTSDNLIRLSALHSGVLRVSAREFIDEVEFTRAQIRQTARALDREKKHTVRDVAGLGREDGHGE